MIFLADMGQICVRSFEALAEISDFAAGLVQRVPKKPSEVKADLQNSTASQDDQVGGLTLLQDDRSWEVHCSVEALAEIFDFAAGLVQRVPKRMSIAKSDL